nr:Gag-Pol polyprotein [Tanacetum cinerariifolium]
MSQILPKNIKEAMVDSAWIEAMQEELHQFDRLDVWELVDRPLCKKFVSKSSDVTAADVPNQRQQQNISPSTSTTVVADTPPLNIHTTPETTSKAPTQAPTVTAIENINQAETNKENAPVEKDEF